MGNRTSYNQVPIGDMNSPSIRSSSLDKTATKPLENNPDGTDLMFVFHDTEDDSAERVVHEQIENQRNIDEELKFVITLNEKYESNHQIEIGTCVVSTHSFRVVCERKLYAETSDVHSICSIMRTGDIVEFCARKNAHHWVVYLGNGSSVQMKNGVVTEENISICDAARSQIGKDSVWSNSECFAAWCRFGRPEFLSDKVEIKDLDSAKVGLSTEKCKIDVYNEFVEIIETKHFTNLVELIKYRRKLEEQ